MGAFFNDLLNSFLALPKTIHVTDIIDIVIVAYLVYKGFQLVRETRAELLLKGIGVLAVAYIAAQLLNLRMLNFLMIIIIQNSVFVLLILFQPEFRRALEQMGRSRLSKIPVFNIGDSENKIMTIKTAIGSTCEAVRELQLNRMGALIVFERETKLGEVINTGVTVDAACSKMLLCNLFFSKAPMHDGAAVIRDGRILAAGCILPLSSNQRISIDLGTRHRAALGISEVSDAAVAVVSEETGAVSLATNGTLMRNISREKLAEELENLLLSSKNDEPDDPETPAKNGKMKLLRFWKKGND